MDLTRAIDSNVYSWSFDFYQHNLKYVFSFHQTFDFSWIFDIFLMVYIFTKQLLGTKTFLTFESGTMESIKNLFPAMSMYKTNSMTEW